MEKKYVTTTRNARQWFYDVDHNRDLIKVYFLAYQIAPCLIVPLVPSFFVTDPFQKYEALRPLHRMLL